MDDYVELTQSLPGPNEQTWNFISKLIKDYFSQEGVVIFHQDGFSRALLSDQRPELFLEPLITILGPPPRV